MKTIGLIGGLSWESSLLYYRIVNEEIKERLGGLHSCKCLMYSVDFAAVAALQHQGEWDKLGALMADAAERLERGGAELLVICANTMHKLADDITRRVDVPLLHIADATAEEIKARGLGKIGLLGTRFTMEGDFYRTRLREKHGIDVIIPDAADREIIHDVIYRELVLGVVNPDSRQRFREIIGRLAAAGAQGVILGCTEIPLLIDQDDSDLPLFDTTRIHARRAVELALA
ncbi:aspartate/glutamate racemase family protein [Anaeroselena agilis]|uniref:Aspartate/glutamate racemase family protein n=1 Tax=Anaeroselena agilis TaxID=3063788 RepID=A0ABU3P0F7_9FIRM|nr:aspartate/glutamate racemase family protein [Selenomonadales bacterium 4137-cl]